MAILATLGWILAVLGVVLIVLSLIPGLGGSAGIPGEPVADRGVGWGARLRGPGIGLLILGIVLLLLGYLLPL